MTSSSGSGPPLLAPMLAGSTGMPSDTQGWVFEPKWDGYPNRSYLCQ